MPDTKKTRTQKKKKIREPYQLKKAIKGLKSLRGHPENPYGEIKQNKSFSLTETGVNLLKNLSSELGISTSELLEQIARSHSEVKAILTSKLSSEDLEIE